MIGIDRAGLYCMLHTVGVSFAQHRRTFPRGMRVTPHDVHTGQDKCFRSFLNLSYALRMRAVVEIQMHDTVLCSTTHALRLGCKRFEPCCIPASGTEALLKTFRAVGTVSWGRAQSHSANPTGGISSTIPCRHARILHRSRGLEKWESLAWPTLLLEQPLRRDDVEVDSSQSAFLHTYSDKQHA